MTAALNEILERSRDPDPKIRRLAVRDLCPCQVKRNDRAAWDRVFEMTRDDVAAKSYEGFELR